MTKRAQKRSHTHTPLTLPYRCTVSVCIAVCGGILLLLLLTAVAYSQPDPTVLARPMALIALYVSSLAGGYMATKKSEHPILASLITGCGIVLIQLMLSFVPWGKSAATLAPLLSIGLYAAVVATSVFGGWLNTKRLNKRGSRRNKRRR